MGKQIEHKTFLRPKHFIAGGIVLVLSLLLLSSILRGNESWYRAESSNLSIGKVQFGIFNDFITITGKIEPISTVYLDAIEGGRVTTKYIEEGEMVRKGDIILKLENRQLLQTILTSEAALAEKENYLRNTQIGFEAATMQSQKLLLENKMRLKRSKRAFIRSKKMFAEEFISKEEYLQAEEEYIFEQNLFEINKKKAVVDSVMQETSMKTLASDLAKMREMLTFVRGRLNDLEVRAPANGQLGMLNAEMGESIQRGQRIGMVHNLERFKINAKVDEHYIDRVRHNLNATMTKQGNDIRTMVKKVYPEVRNGAFEIDLHFSENEPNNLRAGQTYNMKLELGKAEESLLLPRGSFFQNTGGKWLYVLNHDGTKAEKRSIRLGKQNPQFHEVLEGLKAGEQVILSSYDMFEDKDVIVIEN